MTKSRTPVTIWYLAMEHPDELLPKALPDVSFEIRECKEKQHEINQFLYRFVGRHWQWTDKLNWTEQQWQEYAEAPERRTWIAYLNNSPIGYFELSKGSDDVVELDYFGLTKRYLGKGLGGGFLSQAIQQAWELGASRVQVNTCSKDHPEALANYKARGFKVAKQITH